MRYVLAVALCTVVLTLGACTNTAPAPSDRAAWPAAGMPPPQAGQAGAPPMRGPGMDNIPPPPGTQMPDGPDAGRPSPGPNMGGGPGAGMPPTPFKWWQQSEIADALKLTKAQIASIDAISTDGRRAEIELRSKVELAQVDLDAIMDRDTIDLQKAEAAVGQFVQLHADLERARMLTLLEIRSTLTKAQYLKLQQLFKKQAPTPGGPGGR